MQYFKTNIGECNGTIYYEYCFPEASCYDLIMFIMKVFAMPKLCSCNKNVYASVDQAIHVVAYPSIMIFFWSSVEFSRFYIVAHKVHVPIIKAEYHVGEEI